MSVVLLKTSKMPGGALALAVSKALPGTENKWVKNTKQKENRKTDTLACNYTESLRATEGRGPAALQALITSVFN